MWASVYCLGLMGVGSRLKVQGLGPDAVSLGYHWVFGESPWWLGVPRNLEVRC